MKFSFAAVVLLLLSAAEVRADYNALSFVDLLGESQLVALGEITAVSDQTFTLKIERVLIGDRSKKEIEIKKFGDWVCAQRCIPYAVGQREIVFVHPQKDRKTGEVGSLYKLPGAGAEAEWSVVDDAVFPMVTVTEQKHSSEKVGARPLKRVPLADVMAAIEEYPSWFRIEMGEEERFLKIGDLAVITRIVSIRRLDSPAAAERKAGKFRDRQSKSPRTLEDYRRQSGVHQYLVKETEQYEELLRDGKMEGK